MTTPTLTHLPQSGVIVLDDGGIPMPCPNVRVALAEVKARESRPAREAIERPT